MLRIRRRQYVVDRHVQGAFLMRAIVYWCACLAMTTLLTIAWWITSGSARWFQFSGDMLGFYQGAAIVAAVMLLPLVAFDTLVLTNRLVGPLVRLRSAMRRLAAGEQVKPINFRDGDFWQEVTGEFNALIKHVESLRCQAGVPAAPPQADEEFELIGVGSHDQPI